MSDNNDVVTFPAGGEVHFQKVSTDFVPNPEGVVPVITKTKEELQEQFPSVNIDNVVKAKTEELLNEAQEKPEDIAAMMCHLYLPKFQVLVNKLSNKALRRLIFKLIEFPLGDDYKPKSEVEKTAFEIGDRLLGSKYLMIIGTYMESQELNKAMEQKVVAEEAATVVQSNEELNPSTFKEEV